MVSIVLLFLWHFSFFPWRLWLDHVLLTLHGGKTLHDDLVLLIEQSFGIRLTSIIIKMRLTVEVHYIATITTLRVAITFLALCSWEEALKSWFSSELCHISDCGRLFIIFTTYAFYRLIKVGHVEYVWLTPMSLRGSSLPWPRLVNLRLLDRWSEG